MTPTSRSYRHEEKSALLSLLIAKFAAEEAAVCPRNRASVFERSSEAINPHRDLLSLSREEEKGGDRSARRYVAANLDLCSLTRVSLRGAPPTPSLADQFFRIDGAYVAIIRARESDAAAESVYKRQRIGMLRYFDVILADRHLSGKAALLSLITRKPGVL